MATYSRVGLRDVIFWKLKTDTATTLTYESAAETDVVDAIDVSISHANADPDILYADDIENDVLYPDTELTVTLEVKELPLSLQAKLLGNLVGTKKEIVEVAGATPPYYAMGFKSAKRDGNDRYVWLVKGRAQPLDEQFHTKEKAPTRQNDTISLTFIKRTKDDVFKYVYDTVGGVAVPEFFEEVYDGTLPT
ncbi:MAG TPA: phage tail protein [Clostridia bacterium]|nr:phage tail protein [Clostridia bacterium]